jgi:hypothetical protein
MKKIPVKDWKWFGSAGHYICGRWCRFHMCTLVGKYLISTVGEYVHPRHGQGSESREAEWLLKNWPGEDIGYKRKYETMVFPTGELCKVKDCQCGMPTIYGNNIDTVGYNGRKDAVEGHYTLCHKVANGAYEVVKQDA